MPLTLKSPSIGKAHTPSTTFLCPSCRFRNAIYSLRSQIKSRSGFQARRHPPQRRHTSAVAQVTAINAHRELPPPFRELRDSLSSLQTEAAVYVNSSQLQLALRGLESENAVTRVASKTPRPRRMIQLSNANDSSWAQWTRGSSQADTNSAGGSPEFRTGVGKASSDRGRRWRWESSTPPVDSSKRGETKVLMHQIDIAKR